MAWSIRCTFNRIESYAQAVKAWEKAVIFSRAEEISLLAPRGLVDRRKKHLTIERTAEAEDIVLRLYGHDVVTWHKDNSLTISAPRSTVSTGKFASHCSPAGMYVSMWHACLAVTVDGRAYKVRDKITFHQRDGTWKANQVTSPWVRSSVNRERAKQALQETGYEEFRSWFRVYVQMAPRPDYPHLWNDTEKIVHLLRNRSTWRELAALLPDAWGQPTRALETVRQAVYREYECIDRKLVPFLG